jgi:hypothetical protein
MSNRSPDRSELWVLAGLGIVTLAVIGVLVGGGIMRPASEELPFIRTSRSTNVDGVRVWFELLGRLGYQVRRSEVPLSDDALQDADVLLLLDPIRRVQPAELRSVKGWLNQGGVLITTAGALSVVEQTVSIPERGNAQEGFSTVGPGDRPTGPLSRNVDAPPDLPAIRSSYAEWIARAGDDARLLYGWRGEPHMVAVPAGEGEVIVASDSAFLSNGSIGDADYAVLAANLARYAEARAGGNRLVFNEYHFGFGARETSWTLMHGVLARTSAGWSVLACAAAGMLYLLYGGRRFGTRRDPEPRTRRSRMEFVYAAAATMHQAGAHRLAFRLNFDAWIRTQRRRLRLPSSAPVEDLAAELAKRSGAVPANYIEFLRRCHAAAHHASPSPPVSVHALYRRLAELESEVSST